MRELELKSPRMSGDDITAWQRFLSRKGFALGRADGYFGQRSHDATIFFQRRHRLYPDGIVGQQTRRVAREEGFMSPTTPRAPMPQMPPPPSTTRPPRPRRGGVVPPNSTTYPPRPTNIPAPSLQHSKNLFGSFAHVPNPATYNGRGLRVTDGWKNRNIIMITVPQLRGISVEGKPGRGRMQAHRLAAPHIKNLFRAWEEAGLMHLVHTFDGGYAERYIKDTNEPSNHSFGAAFDINYQWNKQPQTPAATGHRGSVREMVPIANDLGFFWGGHYKNGKKDGMHFELVVL